MTRTVAFDHAVGTHEYHSLAQADYISALALLPDGRVPMVRQFRPAVEHITLELPGGLLDGEEPAQVAIAREVREETGFEPEGEPQLIACLEPDSGRLDNRFWCFFIKLKPERVAAWRPEPGVEVQILEPGDIRRAVLDGRVSSAHHVALVGLALMRELI